MHNDYNMSETVGTSFQEWASIIADNCKATVDHVEGEDDNGQYMPELVPLIINVLKLYPCWSGIMKKIFGFGDATVSSSRIESNFNQIKNSVFKNENLPVRVDNFVEKLIHYYRGDHLLTANSVNTVQQENEKSQTNYCNKQQSIEINIKKNHSIKNIRLTYNGNNNDENDNVYHNDNINANTKDYENVDCDYEFNDNNDEYDKVNDNDKYDNNDFNNKYYNGNNNEFENGDYNNKGNNYNDEDGNGDYHYNSYDDNDEVGNGDCNSNGNDDNEKYDKSTNDNNGNTISSDDNNYESENGEKTNGDVPTCLPCRNGDFPSGIHRCVYCNKAVHLFGCSIKNPFSKEGFGESRICLICDNKNKESLANEIWMKKNQ